MISVEVDAEVLVGASDLADQYLADTGQSAQASFGAYATVVFNNLLFAGLGNAPASTNGALVVEIDDLGNLTTEQVLDEQGIADFDSGAALLYVPGSDPTEAWTFGNLYSRNIAGAWAKQRTLPNVIHAWGMCVVGSEVYVAAGAHTGDGETWTGRVLKSSDGGATWPQSVEVADYRVYDVIAHSGRLYATVHNWSQVDPFPQSKLLRYSEDGGLTWNTFAGVTPRVTPRMVAYGDSLLIVGDDLTTVYEIDGSHAMTSHVLPSTCGTPRYQPLAVVGSDLYYIGANGYIYKTDDMTTWSVYSYVANGISLIYWSTENKLAVSTIGTAARLYQIGVTDGN